MPRQHERDHKVNRQARLVPPHDGARARPVLGFFPMEGERLMLNSILQPRIKYNMEESYLILPSGIWCSVRVVTNGRDVVKP